MILQTAAGLALVAFSQAVFVAWPTWRREQRAMLGIVAWVGAIALYCLLSSVSSFNMFMLLYWWPAPLTAFLLLRVPLRDPQMVVRRIIAIGIVGAAADYLFSRVVETVVDAFLTISRGMQ